MPCRQRGKPSFRDVLEVNAVLPPEQQLLDSFALRNLCHGSPVSVAPLSAVRLGSDRYMQRCAIVAHSGEECVLTFTMLRQDALEPR